MLLMGVLVIDIANRIVNHWNVYYKSTYKEENYFNCLVINRYKKFLFYIFFW